MGEYMSNKVINSLIEKINRLYKKQIKSGVTGPLYLYYMESTEYNNGDVAVADSKGLGHGIWKLITGEGFREVPNKDMLEKLLRKLPILAYGKQAQFKRIAKALLVLAEKFPEKIEGPNGEVAICKPAKSHGDWMLKFNGRVRWGNKNQMAEDIEFFKTHGKLPPRKVGGF